MDNKISKLLAQIEAGQVADGGVETSELFLQLEPLAQKHGLAQESIQKGFELVLGASLITSDALALLPLLLPRTPLTANTVLIILAALGAASPVDYTIQQKALEALTIYVQVGVLGSEAKLLLDRLWSVLEKGLEYGVLRSVAANLLLLITRRYHIQEHRIAHLQRLIRSLPAPPPALPRLLAAYRTFSPNPVSLARTSSHTYSKTSVRRSAKLAAWAESVKEVYEGAGATDNDHSRSAKRRKIAQVSIPFGATYDSTNALSHLSDITTLEQLSQHLEKLEKPSQAGSMLGFVAGASDVPQASEEDRARVWGLVLSSGYNQDPEYLERLSAFIAMTLKKELYDLDLTSDGLGRCEDLLCRVRDLCEVGGELLPGAEDFLADFLLTWDGESFRQVIFDLIALLRPSNYDSYYDRYLGPLQLLTFSANDSWLADLISSLTRCLESWGTRLGGTGGLRTASAFGSGEIRPRGQQTSLQAVLEYVDRLIAASVQRFPDSILLRSASLSFYESSLNLPLVDDLPVIILPLPTFTYQCLLAGDFMSISRICGLVSALRDALAGDDTAIPKDDVVTSALVGFLNGTLVACIDIIWLRKALSDQNGDALGLETNQLEALRSNCTQSPSTSLSLTAHGGLAPLAHQLLNQLDPSGAAPLTGVISAASLKVLSSRGGPKMAGIAEFRAQLVEYMESRGGVGLHHFLFTSLQSLIDRSSLR